MASSEIEFEKFKATVCEQFGIKPDDRIVVGASGGLDSTVLLRLLHGAGFTVVAAHVNYGLREEASDGDEAFVRASGTELQIPVHVERVELPNEGNRQEAARNARYTFFRQVATEANARIVAVAHHQADQAETVLLNLFRGTGPHGLAGMAVSRPIAPNSSIKIIRPLLGWSRVDIANLARERGWEWREDASNASDTYRRNWLRNRVLPLIEEEFGEDVSERIANAASRLREAIELVDGEASSRLSIGELRALTDSQRHSRYLAVLRKFAPAAPRREDAVAELDALLDAQPGKRVVWPGVTVWRERDALAVEPEGGDARRKTWPLEIGTSTETSLGTLSVELLEFVPKDLETLGRHVEIIDADVLTEPLSLRFWRHGDRINPLGLSGTKLVSDVLTNSKIPPSKRARQLVLCAAGKIIWLVGHRLAQEARIRSDSERTARLTWSPFEPKKAFP